MPVGGEHVYVRVEVDEKMLEDCAAKLSKAGARVEAVTLPQAFERIPDAHRWISSFEFARNRAWEIDHHWEMISERLRQGRINDGLTCSFEKYSESRALAERCRLQMDDLFGGYDVLLTPPQRQGRRPSASRLRVTLLSV